MGRITSENRKEILKSLENGEKVIAICKKYGISRPTLLKLRSESLRSESLRSESLRSESLRSESLRSESLRSESVSESQSESESESESGNNPQEILLRGRNYHEMRNNAVDPVLPPNLERETEHESEHGLDDDFVQGYLNYHRDQSSQSETQGKTEKLHSHATQPESKVHSTQPEKISQSESKQAKIIKIQAYFKSFPMKVSCLT